MINLACRFCFISSTLFMASTVEIEKDFSSEVNWQKTVMASKYGK